MINYKQQISVGLHVCIILHLILFLTREFRVYFTWNAYTRVAIFHESDYMLNLLINFISSKFG